MAGPNDNGRTPPGKPPDNGKGEGERGEGVRRDGERRNGDDTPRETPSAKVSEGRMRVAVPTPPVAPRNGSTTPHNGSTPVPGGGAAGHEDTVRLDLPVVPRESAGSALHEGAAVPEVRGELVPRGEDPWRGPVDAPSGARVDVGVGRVYVRTFQARGVLGAVLVLLGFLVVLGIVVALFTLAVGIGAALAVGGALAALFGVGAARVRRALKARGAASLDKKDDRG